MSYVDARELKKLEGKKVYLTPTGNNARGNAGKVTTVVVIKVARVFISIRPDGWNRDERYRIGSYDGKGIELDSGYNSGYIMYESMDDIEEVKEILSMSKKISDTYRYQHNYAKLDLETLKKVAKLLEVK